MESHPRGPGNETLHGVLNFIPAPGEAYSAYRLTGTELFCEKCGHQFTESIQTKAKSAGIEAFKSGSSLVSAAADRLRRVKCAACGGSVAPGKFCTECGAPQ